MFPKNTLTFSTPEQNYSLFNRTTRELKYEHMRPERHPDKIKIHTGKSQNPITKTRTYHNLKKRQWHHQIQQAVSHYSEAMSGIIVFQLFELDKRKISCLIQKYRIEKCRINTNKNILKILNSKIWTFEIDPKTLMNFFVQI